MVWDDVLGLLKPECRSQVQYCAFPWNEGELSIESGLPVGRHESDFVLVKIDAISHFASLHLDVFIKIRVCTSDLQVPIKDTRNLLKILVGLGPEFCLLNELCKFFLLLVRHFQFDGSDQVTMTQQQLSGKRKTQQLPAVLYASSNKEGWYM